MERKNYLNRRFTLRETILICVLFVVLFVGLYFGLVFYPLSAQNSELDSELEEVQTYTAVARSRKAEYDRMKAELDRILASGDTSAMPQYNNNEQQKELDRKFQEIFGGIDACTNYGTPSEPSDGVRTRTVSFSFSVTGSDETSAYESAVTLLHALMNTGFRCSMSSLSLSPTGGDLAAGSSVSVSCTINFYELDS